MGAAASEEVLYREAVGQWFACGCWSCSGCCGTSRSEQDEQSIIKRLADNEYYWCGDAWRDYAFHVANQHSLLGIFLCHPLNPFSKIERLCLEWLRVSATISWIVLFHAQLEVSTIWGQDNEGSGRGTLKDRIEIFRHVTLPIMVIQAVLQAIAKESGRPDGWLEQFLGKWCLRVLQWSLIFIWFSSVSAMMGYSFAVINYSRHWRVHVEEDDTPTLAETAKWTRVSLLQGYGTWFVTDLLMPTPIFSWPWAFGFFGKWRRERDESQSLMGWSSSGSSSGDPSAETECLHCPKPCSK